MSNPLRQSLYTLDDCLNGGELKATAAVRSLKRIFPAVVICLIPLAFKHMLSMEERRCKMNKLIFLYFVSIPLILFSGSRGYCDGHSNAWASSS